MFIDARTLAGDETLECDVCIVGAGAAGVSLALELVSSGAQIVVLEAGGEKRAGRSQTLYAGVVNDEVRHLPLDQARYRQLGGTTSLWGGRCIPFDPIDFEARPWVPHSGWPVSHADMVPYYRRAHDWCECGAFSYSVHDALPDRPPQMMPGFEDGPVLASTVERWSPPTHFGKAYGERLKQAGNVRVLLHAVAVELIAVPEGTRIAAVTVATLGGHRLTVRPRAVALAGGGLETTRLLLASDRAHPNGIGNHSDWLGRGYMSHIHGAVARATLTAPGEVMFGYETDPQGVFCRRRITLSADAQRERRLLNPYLLLDRPLLGDPAHGSALLSAAFLLKRLLGGRQQERLGRGKYAIYWQHLRNVLAGSPQVVSVLPRFGRQRFLQRRRVPSLLLRSRSNEYHLYFQSEQVPDRENRVRLATERDVLGMRRLRLDFKVSDADVDSVLRTHELIDAELRRQGCGQLSYEGDDVRGAIRACKAVLGHHIGTTRMARDPADGVVNEDCRVHGVANLFVASSSTFPTSSQANPTLTIVAFAVRLADHLKAHLPAL